MVSVISDGKTWKWPLGSQGCMLTCSVCLDRFEDVNWFEVCHAYGHWWSLVLEALTQCLITWKAGHLLYLEVKNSTTYILLYFPVVVVYNPSSVLISLCCNRSSSVISAWNREFNACTVPEPFHQCLYVLPLTVC
jgi:hypothetical protein